MAEIINTTQGVDLEIQTPVKTEDVVKTTATAPVATQQPVETNALKVAEDQFKTGSISNTNRAELLKITKQEIAKQEALGLKGDEARNAGIKAAQDKLRGSTTTIEPKPVVTPVAPVKVKTPEVKKTEEAPVVDTVKVEEDLIVKGDKVSSDFNELLQSDPTREQVESFLADNAQFKPRLMSGVRRMVKAKRINTKASNFNQLNGAGLYSEVKKGNLVVGSDVWNAMTPEAQDKYNATAKVQRNIDIANDNDVVPNINTSSNLSDTEMLNKGKALFSKNLSDEYTKLVDNPEFKTAKEELNGSYAEITKKKRQIRDIKKKIEEENKGESRAFISAKIRKETELLTDELNDSIDGYNVNLNAYNIMKTEIDDQFEIIKIDDANNKKIYALELEMYEDRRDEMREDQKLIFLENNKILAEQRAIDNAKSLEVFKQELAGSGKKVSKWESRQDGLYALYDDGSFEKAVNGGYVKGEDGNTTYTYTDEDNNPIIETYNVNGEIIGASTQTKLNQRQVDLLNATNGSIIPTRLSSVTNPNGGKECAEYMNDIFIEEFGNKRMGNTYQSKLDVATEKEGRLGSVAVWQPNPDNAEFSKFGHAGVIVGESEDGKKWHIKSSNLSADGKISIVSVPKEVIGGYRSTTLFDQKVDKGFTQAQEQFLKTTNAEDFAGKKEVKEAASSLGLTAEDIYTFNAKNIPVATTSQFETLLRTLNNLKGDDGKFTSAEGFNEVVGFGLQKVFDVGEQNFISGTDAANFSADLKTFLANITIDNLDKMSGVLTDKDIEILKDAGTAISSNISEAQFVKRITELERVYKKALGQDVIEPKDVFYTNKKTGKQFTKESLKAEILKDLQNGIVTPEQVKRFKKKNNLTF